MSNSFEGLAKSIKEVEKFLADVNSMVATVEFDAHNPASIEAAMAQADQHYDLIANRYSRNPLVANIAQNTKSNIRAQILEHASKLRSEANDESGMKPTSEIIELLGEIEDVVLELQSADYQTIGRPMNTLARLVRSPALEVVIKPLTEGIELDSWIEQGQETQGGTVGSAVLKWPESTDAELGTTILLIYRLAEDSHFMQNFAFTFYHAGNHYSSTLRKMVGGLIVPFNRKFARYIKAKMQISNTTSPVMNNITITNSHVGAVQTGDSNVAHVSLVGNSSYVQLSDSLAKLAAELKTVESIPGHDKDEILEIIEDSRKELGKEKPSKTKLGALLPAIGGAVSLISEMAGAVTAVQTAAAALGLPF